MKPVTIAQIGIGHNHADATMATLRKFPQYFEVVGVAEDDPKWLERRRGLPCYEGLAFTSEEKLLATPGLEAVCVEKDVPDGLASALRCARLGLHIHMDKPGGEDYEAFRELVETQRRAGRAFQMAYMYRYNPAIRRCLDMARSGRLGDIFEIDCQMSTTHSPVYRQWLSNFKGGDMYIFGSHLIDLVVWMMGEPEQVATHNINSFPEEARCIDNGLAVLRYPRATCTVRTTSLEANGYHRRQLVVCGTKGTVEIKPMENPTKMSVAWRESSGGAGAPDAREWIDVPDFGGRYDAQLIDFARMVRGETENPFGYDHELSVERTLLRACGVPFVEQRGNDGEKNCVVRRSKRTRFGAFTSANNGPDRHRRIFGAILHSRPRFARIEGANDKGCEMIEKAATDIYTFESLRKGQYTYVDKTAILKEFADDSRGRQFFIARPRRFGKSLAVTTFQALFEGRRDLFQGLAIEPLWDWSRKWPVLRIDMGTMQYETVEELSDALKSYLRAQGEKFGVKTDLSCPAPEMFRKLITDIAATSDDGQCVVLVDEYDKPLLHKLNTPDVTEFKDFLKPFYGVIKYEEGKQRFAFITGVSKFSKVSIFSDLNNLKDYTLHPVAGTLFGFTHEEVRKYYPGKLAELGAKFGHDADWAFDEIVRMYDGYKFHPEAKSVINPVSLGMTFDAMEFQSWWSKTALPTFLIDFFKTRPLDVSSLEVSDSDMNAFEPEKIKPVVLLYQTGYLTIKDIRRTGTILRYKLGFPNAEVESSFIEDLSALYVGHTSVEPGAIVERIGDTLRARDPEGFVEAFKSFFGEIPYDLTDRQNEQSWQAIMYVVMRLIGMNVGGEVRTSKGRIDLAIETATDAYVIEVKRDSTPMKAIAQIREQGYVDKFRLSGKPITLIGIAFSTKKRAVSATKIVREA